MLKTDHPEGILARVNKVLTAHAIPWCATGAAAALQLTHYYQTGLTEIYAPPRAITDPVARELRAQPTKGDADLILIEPPIPAVLTGGLVENGATPRTGAPVIGANKGLFGFTTLPYKLLH
jgi:hypothetical protein